MATTKTSKTKATQEGVNSGAQDDATSAPTEAELAAQKAAQDAADAQAKADAEAAAAAEAKARDEAAAKAALEAEADAAAAAAALTFPRQMRVVNDTAQPWVVRKFIPPSTRDTVIDVAHEDDLHNLRSNCLAVLSISDHYRPEEGKPDALRIVELDDEQA